MEVKLFLFTVLQIHLFSPWSAGRGLLQQHPGGTGRWRGPGCFTRTLRMPRLGLTGQPCARGQEGDISGGGAAWPPPMAGSLQRSPLQMHLYHAYTFAVLLHTEMHVKRGEGASGAYSWQHQSLVPKPGYQSCPRSHFPSPPCVGEIGVIFPSEVRDSHQKKQFGHGGSGGG